MNPLTADIERKGPQHQMELSELQDMFLKTRRHRLLQPSLEVKGICKSLVFYIKSNTTGKAKNIRPTNRTDSAYNSPRNVQQRCETTRNAHARQHSERFFFTSFSLNGIGVREGVSTANANIELLQPTLVIFLPVKE